MRRQNQTALRAVFSAFALLLAAASATPAHAADADGDLTPAAGVTEPVAIDSTVDSVGEAVDIFDFTISDGGGSDGLPLDVSQIVLHVSGTTTDAVRAKLTYRLNGPDASNVAGTYAAGSDTITFSGLSISVANAGSETYTVNAYFNNNTSLTENATLILTVDGDTDLTVGGGNTQMGTTAAVNNGAGSTISIIATELSFTTQPATSISGAAIITQPAVSAVDAFGNVDKDFTETITLAEASLGALTNNTRAAVQGVATFTNLIYTATADQESFTLTANDQDGIGSDLPTVDSNALNSNVVATKLTYSTQPSPLNILSGFTFSFTTVPVVRAVDSNLVLDTDYTTGVTLSEVNGDGDATLSAPGDTDGGSTSTVSITPVAGVATFTGLSISYVNDNAATETFRLRATSGGLTSADSAQFSSSAFSITSASYTASSGLLVVTGSGFLSNPNGADVDASKFSIRGEGASDYALTDTSDVEVDSLSQFTLTLSSTDKAEVNKIINKNGASSTGGTNYNIAVADDWLVAVTSGDISFGIALTAGGVPVPEITSAAYDASSGVLTVTGNNFVVRSGASNDVDVGKLTITGESGNSRTLTSADVEITSGTSFSVALNGDDKVFVNGLLNKDGTVADGGTTYNLAAAEDWMRGADAAVTIADGTSGVTVSNTVVPSITSATYDSSNGVLVVTGSGFVVKPGATNDVVSSLFTLTGQGGQTHTLNSTPDVDITSGGQFSITLGATDRILVSGLFNKNGTAADDGTTYNLAAADNWLAGAAPSADIADGTAPVTVSNVAAPAITSATYNASSGALTVAGSNFVGTIGAANDVDISLLTITGEAGNSHTITSASDVEVASASSFTVTLSGEDKLVVDGLLNKNGMSSDGGTAYNLAAADNWMRGAAASTDIADALNAVTVSAVSAPELNSASYDAATGELVVNGARFVKAPGAANDVDVSQFTITGQGGGTYTLSSSADVEVTSATAFTVALSAPDKAAVNLLLNKEGTSAIDGTNYNIAAADNWMAAAALSVDISDTSGNTITVSGVTPPTIVSVKYTQKTGQLEVTASALVATVGAANDIDVSKFTFFGQGGASYTLVTSPDVEISSSTSFTVQLDATDKAGVDALATKPGVEAADGFDYNLVAADDWLRLSNGDIADNINSVTVFGPDIAVKGNGIEIASGDSTPSTADLTDFGGIPSGETLARTFTIENSGNVALTLTGAPAVSISGANAADFSVTADPAATVAEDGGSTSFTIQFVGQTEGERSAVVSIGNDDSDEGNYSFSIKAAYGTDSDGDGVPDVIDNDDDNDGVDDAQEGLDGTDTSAPDSLIERFTTELCVDWNGFLANLTQILELQNTSAATVPLRYEMRDLAGEVKDFFQFELKPNEQRDFIANNAVGFAENTYGSICIITLSGLEDALDGQYTYYKLRQEQEAFSFDFAFAEEFLVSRSGPQYAEFNNIVPRFSDLEPIVAVYGWIQLTNREQTPQSGELIFYDFAGTEIGRTGVSLKANERRDYPAHTAGINRVGHVAWVPADSSAKFKMALNRYYWGAEIRAGVSLPAQRGSGQKLVTPFDTRSKLTVLEISNVTDAVVTADVDIFTAAGAPAAEPAPTVNLAPRSTVHVVLNNYLAAGLGNLTVDGDRVGSLIVNLIEYGLAADGTIRFVKQSPATEGVGATQASSYNSYLGGCTLRLGNKSNAKQQFTLSVRRYDGRMLLGDEPQTIAANGVFVFDLCALDSGPSYGRVIIDPEVPGVIGGEIIRRNTAGDAELGVSFRP